jgi:hypothetical protein
MLQLRLMEKRRMPTLNVADFAGSLTRWTRCRS